MSERKWCMCETVGCVYLDRFYTCAKCGGKDAYKRNPNRPGGTVGGVEMMKKEFSEADTAKDFLNSLMTVDAPGWVLGTPACAWELGIKEMVINMRAWPLESEWLDDNGYTFEWEKPPVPVHRVGNRYKSAFEEEEEYILSAPDTEHVSLIMLSSGNRWRNPIVRNTAFDSPLSEAEWKKVTGGHEFTLIEKETE